MNQIEKIKKILGRYYIEKTQGAPVEIVAEEICQQFPKSPDNPDGYEPKPDISGWKDDGVTLTYDEPKPDEKLLTDEQIYEILGANKNCNLPYVYSKWLGLLLKAQNAKTASIKDAEIKNLIVKIIELNGQLLEYKLGKKDAECQARVERIFKEIEEISLLGDAGGKVVISNMWLLAFKKREGVK